VGGDQHPVVADAGEPGDLRISADGDQVMTEARTGEDDPRRGSDGQQEQERHRHRPDALVSEALHENRRGPARRAVVAVVEVALQQQPDAHGRDERVDPRLGDEHAVEEPDRGADPERQPDSR
jgi:hypothetical protein